MPISTTERSLAHSTLSTVAIRVHRMDAMAAFYTEAFGAQFREVDTFGLASQFGEVGGITLKLVPLRKRVDFEEYPSHQLGFGVPDVEAVIALAIKHGGRQGGRDASRRRKNPRCSARSRW